MAEGNGEAALRPRGGPGAAFGSHPQPALGAVALPEGGRRSALLGRREEAIALAEEEVAIAREWGAPSGLGHSLRVLGELRGPDGLEELEEAATLLERSDQRIERARAFAALGAELRRARRPTDAREPLRRALELAEQSGAHGLAENVRSELTPPGRGPRTTALDGVESLTSASCGWQRSRPTARPTATSPRRST